MTSIDSLRTLFNGAALMTATTAFTTALVIANGHEQAPIVAAAVAAMSIAGMAFGLCEMVEQGNKIKKLGGSILGNDQPR